MKEAPKLSLPGKLVFPSLQNSGHFSMLGLGDIVSSKLLDLEAEISMLIAMLTQLMHLQYFFSGDARSFALFCFAL